MTDTGEKAFIARVRAALQPGQSPQTRRARLYGRQAPDLADAPRIGSRSAEEKGRLIEDLAGAARAIQVRMVLVANPNAAGQALAALAAERDPEWGPTKTVCAWCHPLVAAMDLDAAFSPSGIAVVCTDAALTTRQVDTVAARAMVGVTAADFCIAASATLALRSRPGQPQSLSLLPSVHAAIITEDQVVADLAECYARMRLENFGGTPDLTHRMTLITGPSKTADIEATLVHGAHGPRELLLFVVTGG